MLLFPEFLQDAAEYTLAEQYWFAVWRGLGPSRDWVTPWLETCFANGEPCRDGNPIFSAFSRGRQRAVRVIQLAPDAEEPSMFACLDTNETEDGEDVHCLVVWCVLSEETSARARELLSRWLMHDGDPAAFEVPS